MNSSRRHHRTYLTAVGLGSHGVLSAGRLNFKWARFREIFRQLRINVYSTFLYINDDSKKSIDKAGYVLAMDKLHSLSLILW